MMEPISLNDSYYWEDPGMPSYTPGIPPHLSISIIIAITVWILLSNSTFIVSIVSSRTLVKKDCHWLLVNLAVANGLVGVLVTPLAAYYEHQDTWQLGRSLCLTWLFLDVFLACVSTLALIMINLDRYVYIHKPFSYDSELRKPTVFVMIALSWLGAATIVVPLFFIGHHDGFDLDIPDMCFVEISLEYAIGMSVAAYFVPCFIIICLTIAILIAVSSAKRKLLKIPMVTHINGRAQFITRNTSMKMKTIATTLTVVNVVYLLMWFPFFLFSTIMGAGGFTLISPTAIIVSIWMSYVNSALNPLLWLLDADIRFAYLNLFCRLCRKRQERLLDGRISKDTSEQTIVLHTTV